MNRTWFLMPMMVVVLLPSLAGGQTAATAPSAAEIDRLIKQLGSERWALREEATAKLIEIGLPAVPAVRAASLSQDLEVSMRCKLILQGAALDRAKRLAIEKEGQAAFLDGNYVAMAAAYAKLVSSGDAADLDYLWLGHARQLQGDWPAAIRAYLEVVRLMEEEIKTSPADDEAGERGKALMPAVAEERVAAPRVPVSTLVTRRNRLLLAVGRMQREEANDLAGAAATFKAGLDYWERYRDPQTLECLREQAVALERLGSPREAIAAWAKLVELAPAKEGLHWTYDVAAVGRLLGKLPPKEPLPAAPGILVLTPQEPNRVLNLDSPAATALACSRQHPFWRFALAPPPGMEFQKIQFACDIEEINERFGGQFICWSPAETPPGARVSIGGISWPSGEPNGRRVLRKEFDIAAGTGAVLFETGSSSRGEYSVHSVEIAATLRPATPGAKPPRPGVWIQNEVLPAGGKLTWNGKPGYPNSATSDLAPGRYSLLYEVSGRKETFRCDAELAAGRKYGLLANLDSPFRWETTNAAFQISQLRNPCPAVVPLPGGKWLAAWVNADRSARMMLSVSKDLKTWEEPWPLPGGAVCASYTPSLLAEEDGTVWMAHFSTRLQLAQGTATDYRLWLSSTRDGRTWTPPRPISWDGQTGTAADTVQLFRGPDGRRRLFWHNQAGEASSMQALRELKDLGLVDWRKVGYAGAHVTAGEKGKLHMVFAGPDGDVQYSVLGDPNGQDWSPPVRLAASEGKDGAYSPQLIVEGDRFALIYEQALNAYLRRGSFSDTAHLSPPVKIANYVVPLNGFRAVQTPEGKIALLAGNDGLWLLTADKKDLVGAAP